MSGTIAKLPVMIVALVIGLILTFTAVMPLVSDYSDTKTFTNEGYFRMSKYTASDTFVAEWDYNSPYQITINNEVYELPSTLNVTGVSIIAGDNYYLRYIPASKALSLYYDGVALLSASTAEGIGMTATLGDESIVYAQTGAGSTSRAVTTMTDFYAVDSEGIYTMKYSDKSAYLNGDSLIYGCGRTNLTNNILGTLVTGNIDDGITVDIWRGVEGTTPSNIKINDSAISEYIDLYKFDSVTFDVAYTYDSVDYTDSLTYSYVIVPYQVTADPDNPTAYKNLVSVLPLFALILLVAGAASLVYFKNKD